MGLPNKLALAAFSLLMLAGLAPASPPDTYTPDELAAIRDLAWKMAPLAADPTNAFADRDDTARLGQALFFAPDFSLNGKVACASCHMPEHGFTDGKALAESLQRGNRNTPTILNVGWQRWFFLDGRADSLWSQALQVIENPKEFGGNRLHVAHAIHARPDLRGAYQAVFGPLPELGERKRFPAHGRPGRDAPAVERQAWNGMTLADRDAVNRVFSNVGKALAAYQRRITSRDAPFDVYVAGLEAGDAAKLTALSPAQKRGLRLFIGKARCNACHSGPNFSDNSFHNLGLATRSDAKPDSGRAGGIPALLANPFNGIGRYSDGASTATRQRLEFLPDAPGQLGKFKTPTLRSVALTGPYMHDGQFRTLKEVVEFYGQGKPADKRGVLGKRDGTLDEIPRFSSEQVDDLVAFLESLTGAPTPAVLLDPQVLAGWAG